MPPLPPVPTVIKLEFLYQDTLGEARECANIQHIAYSGSAPTEAEMATLLGLLAVQWEGTVMQRMSHDLVLAELKGTDLSSSTSAEAAIPLAVPGANGGDYNSIASAVVISWNIARRYRGGHPRSYIPGIVTGDIVNGYQISTAAQAAFTTHANDWLTAVNGMSAPPNSPFQLVSVSYRSGHAVRVAPVVDIVRSGLIHPRLCTQRRRLGKEST